MATKVKEYVDSMFEGARRLEREPGRFEGDLRRFAQAAEN